jgi:hypothetical protein
MTNFIKKYAQNLVALGVGMAIIMLTLGLLHKQFSGNFIGQLAGNAGNVISGNSSGF